MPRAKLQLKSRLLPTLVGLLIILQLTMPYRGWSMLLIALGLTWLICYVWARTLASGLDLKREMRFGWSQVGDRLEERFTLLNDSLLPALWVEVLDHSNMPGYSTTRGTGVSSKSQSEWRTEGVCMRRGVFTLGPTSLTTGDPFGIYTVRLECPESASLMVVPPIIPLPEIEVAPGGRAGEGRPRPNAPERTVSVATVRDYAPGDNMHWIHWPTSARRNALFVRLFDSTPASDWWVVLDMDRAAQVGAGQDSTEEHAITLAASLADLGLRAGKSVGLVTHGEQLVWLPPRGGDTQRWNILRSMALLGPGPLALRELLGSIRPSLNRQASLILITPALDARWLDELLLFVRRGAVPTVLLLDNQGYDVAVADAATEDAPARPDARAASALLNGVGIANYVIARELFDRPEAHPGRKGEWAWRILPTGMAVPVEPQTAPWRPLA